MPRLVWFVLNNGRSVIANCDELNGETLSNAIRQQERVLTFTGDERVDQLPTSEVRDFVLFESRMPIPAHAAIYNFVRVS